MAFTATVEWDVRATGSDTNGGGFDTATAGTDRSKQDAPQFTYTDLVIDGTTNTKITSPGTPFTSAEVGNIINITGGTGFTVQRVQILSVASAAATCDKAVGTLSSTGGAGKLGGGFATPSVPFSLLVAGNTVHIKSATYTFTASLDIGVAPLTLRGFASTHGDLGTKPLLTTSTSSVDIFTQSASGGSGSPITLDNLSLSSTAGTPGSGIHKTTSHDSLGWLLVANCVFDGFKYGVNGDNAGATYDWGNIGITNTEIKNSVNGSVGGNSARIFMFGCYFHDSAMASGIGGFPVNVQGSEFCAANCVFDRTGLNQTIGSRTAVHFSPSTNALIFLTNCVLSNSSGNLVWGSSINGPFVFTNCIFWGAGGWAIFNSGGAFGFSSALLGHTNAFGNNTSGDRSNFFASPGDISLSANPFTSSTDFSLNSTAGGGAACKAAGFPGVVAGVGTIDIGAVQSGGGGATGAMILSRVFTGF